MVRRAISDWFSEESSPLTADADPRMIVFLRRRSYVIYFVSIGLASLFLKATLPVFVIADASLDDGLFVRLAHSLVEGSWLGPFDNRTLAKGSFYPVFMATAFAIGVPLKIAEHFVYLAACGLMSWSIARLSQSRRLGALVFTALAFNPVLWEPSLARVVREGLYTSLSLAVLALASVLLLEDRRQLHGHMRCALRASLGAVFAAFWLTREESAWLYPAVVVLVAASFGLKRFAKRETLTDALGQATWSLVPDLAIPFCVAALIAGSVATLNYMYYGVFLTNEIREGNFKKAYGAFIRIEPFTWTRYIVFSRNIATRIYQVSPSAAELQRYLGDQSPWRPVGCAALQLDPCPSGIAGAWFMWALRDAVAQSGHYKTAANAQNFYARLAGEINDACEKKRISCLPQLSALAPPFRSEYIWPLIGSAVRAGVTLLRLGKGDVGTSPGLGTAPQIELFEDLVGRVAPPAKWRLVEIAGWIMSPDVAPSLFVDEESGRSVRARVEMEPASAVENYFKSRGIPNPKAAHFTIETDCLGSACFLRAFQPGGVVLSAALDALKTGSTKIEKETVLFIDSNSEDVGLAPSVTAFDASRPGSSASATAPKLAVRREEAIWSIMRVFAELYSSAMPALAILALAGLVACGMRLGRAPQGPALLALALACAVACACRIAIVSYIDVSSWHAISAYYLSPATPFVIVLVTLGLYLGYSTVLRASAPR